MLHAAVVREHAAQLQIRQRVHQLRQRQRAGAGRDAAARPDRDVDDDVRHDARLFGRGGQVARVLLFVDRLNEIAVGLPELIARRILLIDGLAVVIRIRSTPLATIASASPSLAQQMPIDPVAS